jgi:hypothetical protein
MGFWHTGYIEFHEPTGIDRTRPIVPPEYPCAQCGATFQSLDDLRSHRFEAHPLRRPVLYVRGAEVGAQPLRVTKPTNSKDVRLDGCDEAVLNGTPVRVSKVPTELSKMTTGTVRIVLRKGSVDAQFELEYRIATEADLEGVETEFLRIAERKRLDTHVVEELIDSTTRFKTAIGYVDGVCSYLYGVLAKERSRDSSLNYEKYEGKFAKAIEDLGTYDRPLSRTIGSLVEFHFNHFADAARLSPLSRAGRTAARFHAWLAVRSVKVPDGEGGLSGRLENLVTDWQTEQILRWASKPLDHLKSDVVEIVDRLHGPSAEYDRVKLRLLLGEVFAHNGMTAEAIEQARALRNLPAFEPWAEGLIQRFTEKRP